MRVIAFGIYSKGIQYPRFNNLLEGLVSQGVDICECRFALGTSFQERLRSASSPAGAIRFGLGLVRSYWSLFFRFLHAPTSEVILVGYPGYFHVPIVRFFRRFRHRKASIVYDVFFSLYDTVVNDRALIRKGSPAAKLVLAIDRWAARAADTVIVDTRSHADYLADLLGIPREKTEVVFVGATVVDVDRLDPSPAERTGRDILFVGTYIPLHGIPTIIQAARILQKHSDLRFVMVGRGQLRREMEAMARRLGLSNMVFVDWVPASELPGVIRKSHLALGIFGVSQKAKRVIPIKAFDICAAGGAMITADTPAIREAFRHRENAYLVPPGNPEALAEAITALMEDSDLRRRIARGARRLHERRFSIPMIGECMGPILGRHGEERLRR